MGLIRLALRRPVTVIVLVVTLALLSVLTIFRTRVDILPNLDLPVIYVAQPYGGMSPQQMEGFISYYYEYHFLYINGIESVEAKSIQGTALLRLTFHPGTNMSEALAQTISYVNRARAFMPPGTVSPFVILLAPPQVAVLARQELRRTGEPGEEDEQEGGRHRPDDDEHVPAGLVDVGEDRRRILVDLVDADGLALARQPDRQVHLEDLVREAPLEFVLLGGRGGEACLEVAFERLLEVVIDLELPAAQGGEVGRDDRAIGRPDLDPEDLAGGDEMLELAIDRCCFRRSSTSPARRRRSSGRRTRGRRPRSRRPPRRPPRGTGGPRRSPTPRPPCLRRGASTR